MTTTLTPATESPSPPHVPSARRRRVPPRRPLLAVVALCLVLMGSLGYWLATTGLVAPTVNVPPGTPSTGSAVATVHPLKSPVTRTVGGATLNAGVLLAKLTMSPAVVAKVIITIAWTNAKTIHGHAPSSVWQLSIGIYHTVKLGTCASSTKVVGSPFS